MLLRKANTQRTNRPDEFILDDIWRSIWKEETIRTIDIHAFSVSVQDGQVYLSGHIAKDSNQQRIEAIAHSISGVVAVHNHLMTDHDLSIQVAQALSEHERTRRFNLPVYSYHGWISILGEVPNHKLQLDAEETAGRAPTVRGVIMLPRITGESSNPERRAVQPQIGVRVYGENEIEGIVTQVIIHPHNRLVTHAVVQVNYTKDSRPGFCDYLVPVEAMHLVDEGGIFLNRNTATIFDFPVFHPANYPFAPITWQPPYPYRIGSVRWPRQEKVEAHKHFWDVKTMEFQRSFSEVKGE